MPITLNDIFEFVCQLPPEDRQSLLLVLLDEEEAVWRKELGKPELSHLDWFAGRVQKSLESSVPRVSTEEAMSRAREAVRRASRSS